VVGSRLIGTHGENRTESLVRPTRQDVGACSGGRTGWEWVVNVSSKWQIVAQRTHIGHLQAKTLSKLLLNREIQLIGVGPAEVRRRTKDAASGYEPSVIWERRRSEALIWVRQGCPCPLHVHICKAEANSKRLKV